MTAYILAMLLTAAPPKHCIPYEVEGANVHVELSKEQERVYMVTRSVAFNRVKVREVSVWGRPYTVELLGTGDRVPIVMEDMPDFVRAIAFVKNELQKPATPCNAYGIEPKKTAL